MMLFQIIAGKRIAQADGCRNGRHIYFGQAFNGYNTILCRLNVLGLCK